MVEYAWKITWASPSYGLETDKGQTGPSDAPPELVKQVELGGGEVFRMVDGDDLLYYIGRIVGANGFEPLDDFGAAAGCTDIDYYNVEKKKWERT